LLDLEEKIFEQDATAREYDDEIERLGVIVRSEGKRLYDEALAEEVRAGRYLSPQERWNRVCVNTKNTIGSPTCRPHIARRWRI
jgi:hypothetical protein